MPTPREPPFGIQTRSSEVESLRLVDRIDFHLGERLRLHQAAWSRVYVMTEICAEMDDETDVAVHVGKRREVNVN